MVGEDVMLPKFIYMYRRKLWNIVGLSQSYVEGLKTNQIKNIDICIYYQKFCHMQPLCLQLGCNCLSHATIFGFLCNYNGFLPPFWVCMQLWCNYDHLHPNLWMISVIYHRIYLICIYSQLHVQPKQANYGLLVSYVHIFCNQRLFFQTQLENMREYCRGLRCLSRASQQNPKPWRWKP